MEETKKKPWQSKTLVLNAIMGLLSGVAIFWPDALGISENITKHAAEIGAAWSVLGIVLRLVTKNKVALID